MGEFCKMSIGAWLPLTSFSSLQVLGLGAMMVQQARCWPTPGSCWSKKMLSIFSDKIDVGADPYGGGPQYHVQSCIESRPERHSARVHKFAIRDNKFSTSLGT